MHGLSWRQIELTICGMFCRCLEALQLQATLQAIQRYFFMGAGDWADALVSAYCFAGPSPEPHSLHACHSMLDAALQVIPLAGVCCVLVP